MILNLKLVILLEYQNIKIFLQGYTSNWWNVLQRQIAKNKSTRD